MLYTATSLRLLYTTAMPLPIKTFPYFVTTEISGHWMKLLPKDRWPSNVLSTQAYLVSRSENREIMECRLPEEK